MSLKNCSIKSSSEAKILACLFFAIAVLFVVIVFSLENRPHAFKECSFCHAQASPEGAMARKLTRPVTMLCLECHEKTFSAGYMHPVDVKPQYVMIPSDMPLSGSGEIICATCHDVHSDYLTPYGSRTRFLRRQEKGRAFCGICHGDLDWNKGHRASLGEAHFQSRYFASDSSQEIDSMSRNCISCHDGTYASSVTIRAGVWRHGKEFMRHDQGSHPIGVDYEAVRLNRGSRTDLKPISEVDPRIRFFNGKVGCGSCHDPYSTIRKQLVMSDERSRLCYSCHIV